MKVKKPTPITGRLNTTQLIEVVAADLGVTTSQAREAVLTTFDVIARAAASGHDVAITNFGTWRPYRVKRRKSRNPQNGEAVIVPAHQKLRFKISPALAAAVRRRDRKFTIRKTCGRTSTE